MNGLFRRRDLPHLDVPGGIYFATFCLAGSLPTRGRRAVIQANFAAFDRMLDESPPVRWLADHRLADVVRQGILHGQGWRYELLAFVVMPNHGHIVFAPSTDRIGARPAREAILHSLKRHTANRCNRLLGRHGPFWQPESYDRLVRGPAELERVIDYVERNPVRAGLCAYPADWEFSSAHARPRTADNPHSAG